MDDQTIKNVLLAISKHTNQTLESHLALSQMLAKKMTGLSQNERQEWLTAIESDKKRLGLLKEILQILE